MKAIHEKAREYARNAHQCQLYDDKSYIFHLSQVFDICNKHNLPTHVQTAAYLHDILEDTKITIDELIRNFGIEVAYLVYAVTDEKGDNRSERKEKTYPKILSNPYGVHLKLADRIANVTYSIETNNKEKIAVYYNENERFTLSLYYPDIAVSLWEELNKVIQQEA